MRLFGGRRRSEGQLSEGGMKVERGWRCGSFWLRQNIAGPRGFGESGLFWLCQNSLWELGLVLALPKHCRALELWDVGSCSGILMTKSSKRWIASMLTMFPLLLGCPRFASIEAFNNTSVRIAIGSKDETLVIDPTETGKFIFLSRGFEIASDLGVWTYPRKVPHGGENGPFFDGTLRIQVDADGTIYALRHDMVPPITDSEEQPMGYPLHPLLITE